MTVSEYIKYFDTLSVSTKWLFFLSLIFFLVVFREVIKNNFGDMLLVLTRQKKLSEIKLFQPPETKPKSGYTGNFSGVQTKVVHKLPANCMINPDAFFTFMEEKIKEHREKMEAVVLDLSDCDRCNERFRNGLIDSLRKIITENNILVSIIFPKSDAFSDVEEWLEHELERTGSKTIRKWTDKYE